MAVHAARNESPTDLPCGGWFPFWFWNGSMEAEEIRRQVGEIARAGCRGFILHPRQGLEQPYLSDSYLALVEIAVEEADRLGLKAQLYDELPYPSGSAGGLVVLGNPHFHATMLRQSVIDVPGGDIRVTLPAGKVLACVACPMRSDGSVDWTAQVDLAGAVGPVFAQAVFQQAGLTAHNRSRYFVADPTPVCQATLPPGPHRLFASVQVLIRDFKYFDTMVDSLNPQAIAATIRCTHERYYRRLGKYFGKTIGAIFTDETSAGWSDRLPGVFVDRCGYDLLPMLPALQDPSHPRHAEVRRDLHRVQYQMFVEAYDGPISAWCREHGIQYWGEKPSMLLEQLNYFGVPGCDAGHTRIGQPLAPDLLGPELRHNALAAVSAALWYDKPAASCEAFHSMGWGTTLADLKRISDGLLVLGITVIIPHAFFYSTHALRKHDGPPSLFFQMPWWPMFPQLVQYTQRIVSVLEQTRPAAQVLVIDPSSTLSSSAQRAVFAAVQAVLVEEHIDFLIAGTEVLSRAAPCDGRLQVAGIAARLLIVTPGAIEDRDLNAWLDRATRTGVRVLRVAEPVDREHVAQAVRRSASPLLEFARSDGTPAAGVWSATRKSKNPESPGEFLHLLFNTEPAPATIDVQTLDALEEMPTGAAAGGELIKSAEGYRRRLGPGELVAIWGRAGKGHPDPTAPPTRRAEPISLRIAGLATVRLSQPNLLRLGKWRLTVRESDAGASAAPIPAVTVTPATIAHQITAAGVCFAPAIRQSFGRPPELLIPPLRASYSAAFANRGFTGPVQLVMEPGAMAGNWKIVINDSPPITDADFLSGEILVRGTRSVEVQSRLRPGENRIVVAIDTSRPDDGLLAPLYLAGSFAAEARPLAIRPWTPAGIFGDFRGNGMPFYSGEVEYQLTVLAPAQLPAIAGAAVRRIELEFDPPMLDACAVSINESPWHPLPWQPHVFDIAPGIILPGPNDVRIRVLTTMLHAFEGVEFDPARHTYSDIE